MAYTPHMTNGDAWKKHFMAMVDGKVDYNGSFYKLNGAGATKADDAQPIKVVAPSAQVIEQAKSEISREERQVSKRKSALTNRKPPSKRGKSKLLKDSEDHFFSDKKRGFRPTTKSLRVMMKVWVCLSIC